MRLVGMTQRMVCDRANWRDLDELIADLVDKSPWPLMRKNSMHDGHITVVLSGGGDSASENSCHTIAVSDLNTSPNLAHIKCDLPLVERHMLPIKNGNHRIPMPVALPDAEQPFPKPLHPLVVEWEMCRRRSMLHTATGW